MTLFSPLVLGYIALFITCIQYIPYVRGIFLGTTRPHAFSWFIWAVLTGIAFFAQVQDGAGAGAWVTGFTALTCTAISILAVFKGEKDIKASDWATFLVGLAAIPLWLIMDNPLYAVILITVIDALAFWPTVRKSWHKPHEEYLFTYTLSALKFMFGCLALENITWVTALYPFSLVVLNGGFVMMAMARRRTLARRT